MDTGSPTLRALADVALEKGPTPGGDGLVVAYQSKADRVELQIMEDRFPPVDPLVEDAGVWYGSIPVAEDGSVEYRVAVVNDGRRRTTIDPSNPEIARNPFGRNSVANGPNYQPPTWLDASPGVRGSIETLTLLSEVWEGPREHQIYLAPGLDQERSAPVLIMHDGPEYVEYAGLAHCLDVLITRGDLPPLIVLLHRPVRRNQEYSNSERHLRHVYDEVLTVLRSRYRIGSVFAGGASLGGVASVSLAFHRPGTIDALVLQSASLVSSLGGRFKRGSVFKPVIPLVEEIMAEPNRLPATIAMSCGTYDGLVEDHRQRVPILSAGVPDLAYSEINAGHHWRCWRDRLEPDLVTAFAIET